MIVKCTDCHAAYSVDDSKVLNKKFGFTCPKCGTNVIMDNRPTRVLAEPDSNSVSIDNSGLDMPSGTDDFGDFFNEEQRPHKPDTGKKTAVSSLPEEDRSFKSDADIEFDDFDLSSLEKAEAPSTKDTVSFDETTPPEPAVSSKEDSIMLEDFDTTEDILLDDYIESDRKKAKVDIDETLIGELSSEEVPDLDNLEITEDDFKPLEEDLDRHILDEELNHAAKPSTSREETSLEFPDIDLSELDSEPPVVEARSRPTRALATEPEIEIDESITIDLDSLDIDLAEEPAVASSSPAEPAPELDLELELSISDFGDDLSVSAHPDQEPEPAGKRSAAAVSEDNDQDLTLDLDSLDITLDEIEEFKEGEVLSDDERLTIEDAGLTIDELEQVKTEYDSGDFTDVSTETDNEELKLSIDEIDPNLRIDDLGIPEPIPDTDLSENLLTEEIRHDDLPEIDFDKFNTDEPHVPPVEHVDALMPVERDVVLAPPSIDAHEERLRTSVPEREDFLDIESRESYERYQSEIGEDIVSVKDTVPRGSLNFSIDYSLKYSRVGAVLRLLGIYNLLLVPHFFILCLYMALSGIVGFFNWLIVLFSGQIVLDFSELQEKTLRYLLSISAFATNTVEEKPRFTGLRDIDHSLQMSVTYPVKPSRLLAFLRITGIGILIAAFPHLVLLSLISIGCFIISLAGILSIIALGKWPGILFDFMVRYYRYYANVTAFLIGLVDHYPSFRFE